MSLDKEEIRESLDEATHGEEWTNFNGQADSRIVYEYDRLTEDTCDIITECKSVETAHFIANAPDWLRALLTENDHWQQCFIDANRDWARVGNQLLDEKNKTDELTAQLTESRQLWGECEAQNQQLREELERKIDALSVARGVMNNMAAELAAKDKVLDWYADEKKYVVFTYEPHIKQRPVLLDNGDKSRSILAQYKAVSHET